MLKWWQKTCRAESAAGEAESTELLRARNGPSGLVRPASKYARAEQSDDGRAELAPQEWAGGSKLRGPPVRRGEAA